MGLAKMEEKIAIIKNHCHPKPCSWGTHASVVEESVKSVFWATFDSLWCACGTPLAGLCAVVVFFSSSRVQEDAVLYS